MSATQLGPDPSDPPLETAARADAVEEPAARRILGMRVDATSYAETARDVAAWAGSGAGAAVCVATVHMVMEAFDDPDYRALVNASERVTPDGVPLVWALRWLGVPRAQRVYGPTLLPEVCAVAQARRIPVGLYGGAPEVLAALREALARRFPQLEIAFSHSPPFRALTPAEEAEVVAAIRASGTRILFVGLGCPKQERWMADHRSALPCAMLGVGAAFEYVSGARRQAPAWLQRAGLEWLFRLLAEPRRLWRRYLVLNPRFVFHFGRQLLRARRARERAAQA